MSDLANKISSYKSIKEIDQEFKRLEVKDINDMLDNLDNKSLKIVIDAIDKNDDARKLISTLENVSHVVNEGYANDPRYNDYELGEAYDSAKEVLIRTLQEEVETKFNNHVKYILNSISRKRNEALNFYEDIQKSLASVSDYYLDCEIQDILKTSAQKTQTEKNNMLLKITQLQRYAKANHLDASEELIKKLQESKQKALDLFNDLDKKRYIVDFAYNKESFIYNHNLKEEQNSVGKFLIKKYIDTKVPYGAQTKSNQEILGPCK